MNKINRMKKRMILLVMALLFLIVPAIVSSAKVDSQVFEKLNDEQEVSVIVMLKDGSVASRGLSALGKSDKNQIFEQKKAMIKVQQDKVLSKLDLKGKTGNLIKSADAKGRVSISSDMDFSLRHKYSTVNGFSGTITEQGLEKLMDNSDVKGIYLDKIVHATLDQSIPQINADDVWPIQLNSINITGLDETICIIDTGIDYNHSALGNGWGNKIITGYNAITQQECAINNSACFDDNGHGTHCAGIAASENEIYKGVAPDAKLVAIKAMDSSGEGLDSDVIAGIDWCVNNASEFNISVISMSLGIDGTAYNNTYCDADYSEFTSAVNSAVGEGILVAISSGNCVGIGCTAGISVPSCIENVTPVGAVNDADTIGFQRGFILDLLAPGYNIYSTLQNNNWGLKSGTSMAAPHVAGAAALLKQFVRLYNGSDITPKEIEDVLNNTGTEIDDTSSSGRNYSRIDVYSTILSLDTDHRLTTQDNTAPIITANATSPTTIYTNTSFKLNLTITDPDSDNLTGYVQFYVNKTANGSVQSQIIVNNTNTLVGTLGSGNFSKDYNLIAEFWAGDGTANTTKENATQVIVQNSIPIIEVQNTFVNCSAGHCFNVTAGVIDADGGSDIAKTNISTVNGTCEHLVNTTSGNYFNVTFNCSGTSLNSTNIIIGFNDSSGAYVNSTSSYNIYPNQAPSAPTLTSPAHGYASNATENVTMNWTESVDADSDTISYYVTVNGTQACHTADLNCTYETSAVQDYVWNITPYDCYENGTASSSRTFSYDLTKPVVTAVSSSGVTSSGATLTATTDENATCAYSTSNISYTDMTTFTTTGTISHSVSLSGLSASTSYTYYVRCMDYAGNIMNTSNSTAFTTLSGGGGRGGGGSSVSYEQKSLGTLAAGSSKKITFMESNTHGITEIEIKVKNRVTNAKIRVDTGSLPSGASLPSTKVSVYKYIEITKVDLSEDDIENAVIKFKVKKEWLTEKGYGKDTVALHRYYNNKWTKLTTKRDSQDTTYYYYSAESPGFSTFAITAEKAPAVTVPAEEPEEEKPEEAEVTEEEIRIEEEAPAQVEAPEEEKEAQLNTTLIVTLIAVIIILAIVGYFFQEKKKKEQKSIERRKRKNTKKKDN